MIIDLVYALNHHRCVIEMCGCVLSYKVFSIVMHLNGLVVITANVYRTYSNATGMMIVATERTRNSAAASK